MARAVVTFTRMEAASCITYHITAILPNVLALCTLTSSVNRSRGRGLCFRNGMLHSYQVEQYSVSRLHLPCTCLYTVSILLLFLYGSVVMSRRQAFISNPRGFTPQVAAGFGSSDFGAGSNAICRAPLVI